MKDFLDFAQFHGLGDISIWNGDCIEVMDWFIHEGEKFDMIFCDLPYGTTQCSWDAVIPFADLWDRYDKLITDNGVIALFSQQPFTSNLIMSNPKMYKYSWVWEKSKATGFLNAKKRPLVAHEEILIFCKGTPVYYPQMTIGDAYNKGVRKQQTEDDVYGKFEQVEVKSEGQRYPRSVQYFKTAESEGKTYHKTQKPVELLKYFINTYTTKGQRVLDNCVGSGSAMIACIDTARKGVGIELKKDIYEAAVGRIHSYSVNLLNGFEKAEGSVGQKINTNSSAA